MAKKKWSNDRKWDRNNTEKKFEELLLANGFTINGTREYLSKTDYLIEKDGVTEEFSIHGVDNSTKRGELCYNMFEDMYNMKVKLIKLKAEQKG